MTSSRSGLRLFILIGWLIASALQPVRAADAVQTREGVAVSISARSPEQIEAFYAARGFPTSAVSTFRNLCFFTVGIRNGSNDVVWLELKRFSLKDDSGKNIARITRPQWKKKLRALGVPQASQSTFGWTQLPEQRDLQPDEPVGGNIAIPRQGGRMLLKVDFRRDGKPNLEFEFPGLRCAD